MVIIDQNLTCRYFCLDCKKIEKAIYPYCIFHNRSLAIKNKPTPIHPSYLVEKRMRHNKQIPTMQIKLYNCTTHVQIYQL